MAQAQLQITNETTIQKRDSPIDTKEAIEILNKGLNYVEEIPFRPKGKT